jgi:hypothetical protein
MKRRGGRVKLEVPQAEEASELAMAGAGARVAAAEGMGAASMVGARAGVAEGKGVAALAGSRARATEGLGMAPLAAFAAVTVAADLPEVGAEMVMAGEAARSAMEMVEEKVEKVEPMVAAMKAGTGVA